MEQAARAAAGAVEQEQHQEQRGVTVDKEAKQSRETGGRRGGGGVWKARDAVEVEHSREILLASEWTDASYT